MTRLTDQELATVRGLVQEFNGLKMQLADTVLSQQAIAKKVEEVKATYIQMELSLIETYGKDSSINIDTGEITTKEATPSGAVSMEVIK